MAKLKSFYSAVTSLILVVVWSHVESRSSNQRTRWVCSSTSTSTSSRLQNLSAWSPSPSTDVNLQLFIGFFLQPEIFSVTDRWDLATISNNEFVPSRKLAGNKYLTHGNFRSNNCKFRPVYSTSKPTHHNQSEPLSSSISTLTMQRQAKPFIDNICLTTTWGLL